MHGNIERCFRFRSMNRMCNDVHRIAQKAFSTGGGGVINETWKVDLDILRHPKDISVCYVMCFGCMFEPRLGSFDLEKCGFVFYLLKSWFYSRKAETSIFFKVHTWNLCIDFLYHPNSSFYFHSTCIIGPNFSRMFFAESYAGDLRFWVL